MVNLLREFVVLRFNDVCGLTTYFHTHDALRRDRSTLVLKEDVNEWCVENFGYRPILNVHKRGKKVNVYLRLANDADKTLFRIRYANHFLK